MARARTLIRRDGDGFNRRRAVAALAALTLLGLAVGAAAAGAGDRGRVLATSSGWVRSPDRAVRCARTDAPNGATGDPLPLANGVSALNLWNVGSSVGEAERCYSPAGVSMALSLSSAAPDGPGPAGYPELAYGFNLLDRPFCASATPCATHPFPIGVAQLDRRYALSVSYALGSSPLPHDFIYDLWLERAPVAGPPADCSTRPAPANCPQPGDIELLIVLDHSAIPTCSAAPANVAEAITLDGRDGESRWRECTIVGGTAASSLAFFLLSPPEHARATIVLHPGDFIAAAAAYLRTGDLSAYDLMGVELGGEFDFCTAASCPAGAWEWRVSRLSLRTPTAAVAIVGD